MELEAHITLIIKELSGEISAIELIELQNWKAASGQNQRAAEAFQKTWRATENLTQTNFSLDLEVEFSHLQNRISGDAAKIIPLKTTANWRQLAAAAAVLAIVAVGSWFFFATKTIETIAQNSDTKSEINLSDGSHVFVNKHSTLRYPTVFSGNERRVKLSGEAFFDIAKNVNLPFIVETDFANIRVLGTHFNVKTGLDRCQIDVQEGVVRVEGGGLTKELRAGEGVIFYQNGAKVQPTGFKQNAAAWAQGELIFKDKILMEVCEDLGHFYDVEISIQNQKLLSKTFSWSQPKNITLERALNIVAATFGASVTKISPGKYQLVGGR